MRLAGVDGDRVEGESERARRREPERGAGRRPVPQGGTRPNPAEVAAQLCGRPRASAEASGALASCPPAGATAGGEDRCAAGQGTDPAAPPPGPACALTVGAVALPRSGHLLRAEAALGCHREAAQHVGGREQVRLLHAARLAVRAVRAASARGYCAGLGGLGPGRAPREVMSALGPPPTAVAAAAEARARMLRPGLPPRGGAARSPPPHSHPFRPPSEPQRPAPARPGAPSLPAAHSTEGGTEAAGRGARRAGGAGAAGPGDGGGLGLCRARGLPSAGLGGWPPLRPPGARRGLPNGAVHRGPS